MPNRAPELTWEEPQPPAQGGLTRSALVSAALAIADSEGLKAVSIRRLAAELGTRPMSLYTHIASKDDLLDLMVHEALADVLVPEPMPEHWRDALAEVARHAYSTFVAHPWVLEAFSRPQMGPNVLRHAEQSASAVAGLGLDAREAATVLEIVDDYAIGHALRAVNRAGPVPPLPELDPIEFPHLAARVAQEVFEQPYEDTFEIGLDAVLDGIERRFAS